MLIPNSVERKEIAGPMMGQPVAFAVSLEKPGYLTDASEERDLRVEVLVRER